jgi:outer membrane protein OmpA-like peptidoglycan-associated protein
MSRSAPRLPAFVLLMLVGLLPSRLAQAQGFVGLSASNYAGTQALAVNPSSIADSRYRLYVNIGAADANLYNNYLKVDMPFGLVALVRNRAPDKYRNAQGHVVFDNNWLTQDLNGRSKFATVSGDVRLPTVQVALPHQQSVAFGSRVRSYLQVNNVSEPLAQLSRFGLGDADELGLANQLLKDNRFSINLNTWQEFNASYARVILPKGPHFLKAGATVKYLVGLGGGYINNEGLGYVVHNSDSIQVTDRKVSYGYTDYRYYQSDYGFRTRNLYNKNRLGRGLGLDLGLTYEFRPDAGKYTYAMDGQTDLPDDTQNKYKLRVGLAVVDLGRVKYANQTYVSSSKLTGSSTLPLGSLDTLTYRDLDHVDVLTKQLVGVEARTTTFKSRLPHTLNLTADYHLRDHFYVGALWSQSLLSRYAVGVRTFSQLTLIPRFEKQKVEFSLPISLADDYRRFGVGAMLRVGPAFIGSDNLAGVLGKGRVSGYDLYVGVAFALYQRKPLDRDGDGVSDKVDSCPDVKGVWEFKGCPDRDGDHVADVVDKCPDDPGSVEFQGCPDRDGDKIIDRDDQCPDVAGPAEFQGCPDRDGDKIIDRDDQCPDVPGVAEFKGCPDRDGDHVADQDDHCPDLIGSKEHFGCPDTDADGLYDDVDQCPTVAGPVANKGCPIPDTDGDGVPDPTDLCPLTPGPAANNGCPVLTPVETQILKTAFSNLEFEFRKAVIRPSSFPALRELANLLDQKPTYRLRLAGHTDNVGTTAANLKLSELRATSVKTYLVQQGIDASRFEVEFYGSFKPIDTNKTAAGRERNRRVEMTAIFE